MIKGTGGQFLEGKTLGRLILEGQILEGQILEGQFLENQVVKIHDNSDHRPGPRLQRS